MSNKFNSINSVKNNAEAIANMSERENRYKGLSRDLAIVATSAIALAKLDDVKKIDFNTHNSTEASNKRALDQAATEASAQAEYIKTQAEKARTVEDIPFGSHEDYERRQAIRNDRYDGTPNLSADEVKTVNVISGEATDYELAS